MGRCWSLLHFGSLAEEMVEAEKYCESIAIAVAVQRIRLQKAEGHRTRQIDGDG